MNRAASSANRTRRRRTGESCLAFFVAAVLWVLPAAAQVDTEKQVEAVFLYNFSSFVRWPAQAFETRASPLRYCVAGDAEMARLLTSVLEGERSGRRPLELIEEPVDSELASCHVLFLGADDEERAAEILGRAGQTALTVSDREDLYGQGLMIRMALRNRHVHPWIDLDAVERSDLQISAKLLRLATVIRDRQERPR